MNMEKLKQEAVETYGIKNEYLVEEFAKCLRNYYRGLFSQADLDFATNDILTDYAHAHMDKNVSIFHACADVVHKETIRPGYAEANDYNMDLIRHALHLIFDNIEVVNIYRKNGELQLADYTINRANMWEVCRDGLYPIPVKYIQ